MLYLLSLYVRIFSEAFESELETLRPRSHVPQSGAAVFQRARTFSCVTAARFLGSDVSPSAQCACPTHSPMQAYPFPQSRSILNVYVSIALFF